MRKSNLKRNHQPFDDAVSRYRAFMEKIIGAQRVISTAQEKRDVAESVLRRLCANWENFVDEHIVDCVNCDPSQLSEHFGVSIPKHPTWDLCHALIIGDGYTDFRSFGDLKGKDKRTYQLLKSSVVKYSMARAAIVGSNSSKAFTTFRIKLFKADNIH